MAEPDKLTADRLAELLGVSTKTVRDLAARGIAVRAGRGQYEMRSIPRYCEHLRRLATGKAGGEAVAASAAAARARLAAPGR